MIPFFVADRPASLRILRGSRLEDYGIKVGLMSHANTSKEFQELFSLYPCSKDGYCEIVRRTCPFCRSLEKCLKGSIVKRNIVTMCDSGIFQKGGCTFGYRELFSVYENMKASYGIIIDCFKQKDETIESAKEAYDTYGRGGYSFKLVGVSQGKTLKEYVDCYEELKKMGYSRIAIGGLLKKAENSVRFVQVHSEQLLNDVVSAIRKKYPDDWLFVLGCYRLKRHEFLSKMHVFGSDYKGWIFNYDIGKGQKDANLIKSKTELRRLRFKQTRQHLKEVYEKVLLSSNPQTPRNPLKYEA